MAKRLISFRISKEVFEIIREEADRRSLALSTIIEERLDPYSEFKKQDY